MGKIGGLQSCPFSRTQLKLCVYEKLVKKKHIHKWSLTKSPEPTVDRGGYVLGLLPGIHQLRPQPTSVLGFQWQLQRGSVRPLNQAEITDTTFRCVCVCIFLYLFFMCVWGECSCVCLNSVCMCVWACARMCVCVDSVGQRNFPWKYKPCFHLFFSAVSSL